MENKSTCTIVILGLGNIGFSLLKKLLASSMQLNLVLVDNQYPNHLDEYLKNSPLKEIHKITFHKVNCTDRNEVSNLAKQLHAVEIDLIVATIGVLWEASPLADFSKFKQAFGITFFGNAMPIHALYPLVKKNSGSRIIAISSTSGIKAPKVVNDYAPSKWAMENFLSSLRVELKDDNIHVDIIRPTNIKNEYSESFHIYKGISAGKVISKIYPLIEKSYKGEKTDSKSYFIPFYFRLVRISERVFPWVLDIPAHLKSAGKRAKKYKTYKINKVLITGASSGLGREFALLYAARAEELILTGRGVDSLNALRDEISKKFSCKVQIVKLDLSDVEETISFTHKLSGVDLLINNAGLYTMMPFTEMKMEEFKKIMDVNFFVPVLLTSELIKKGNLKKVINVLSTTAIIGRREHSAYSSSKAALWVFSKSLRRQYGNDLQVVEAMPSTFISNLFRDVAEGKMKKKATLQAHDVALEIMKCEQSGGDRVFIPFKSKLFLWMESLCFPVFKRLFMK